MEKNEFLVQQKERSRELFMETGDRSHLLDMIYFEERIKQEKLDQDPRYQTSKALEHFAIAMLILVITSPLLAYLMR